MKRTALLAAVLAAACQTEETAEMKAVNATLKDIPVDIWPVFPTAGEKYSWMDGRDSFAATADGITRSL